MHLLRLEILASTTWKKTILQNVTVIFEGFHSDIKQFSSCNTNPIVVANQENSIFYSFKLNTTEQQV